jgi:hypothetical protein
MGVTRWESKRLMEKHVRQGGEELAISATEFGNRLDAGAA